MIGPALLYLAITGGAPALRAGWAIPAATDIAFAIGVLALLGSRVPASLKLFLTTVAIVDDMGAVAIIAVFYSHGLDVLALAGAVLVAGGMFAMNRLGVVRLWPYLIGFALLWVLVLMSGVHATIAGVVTAMLIPIRLSPGVPDHEDSTLHRLEHAPQPVGGLCDRPAVRLRQCRGVAGRDQLRGARPAAACWESRSPCSSASRSAFSGASGSRCGCASPMPPSRTSWPQIYGVSLLAGIGFTMSLFIGGLAFPGNAAVMDEVKIGVLAGSILSALAGFLVLRFAPEHHAEER